MRWDIGPQPRFSGSATLDIAPKLLIRSSTTGHPPLRGGLRYQDVLPVRTEYRVWGAQRDERNVDSCIVLHRSKSSSIPGRGQAPQKEAPDGLNLIKEMCAAFTGNRKQHQLQLQILCEIFGVGGCESVASHTEMHHMYAQLDQSMEILGRGAPHLQQHLHPNPALLMPMPFCTSSCGPRSGPQGKGCAAQPISRPDQISDLRSDRRSKHWHQRPRRHQRAQGRPARC